MDNLAAFDDAQNGVAVGVNGVVVENRRVVRVRTNLCRLHLRGCDLRAIPDGVFRLDVDHPEEAVVELSAVAFAA